MKVYANVWQKKILFKHAKNPPKTWKLLLPLRSGFTPLSFRRDASTRKTSQDLGGRGGRGKTGFLPSIQKPGSPRLVRPFGEKDFDLILALMKDSTPLYK
jgi:hypothetical protein